MKKFLSVLFILVLTLCTVAFSACKPKQDDSPVIDDPPTGQEEPPVIVVPEYNVIVNIELREYSPVEEDSSTVIERSYATVYGLEAIGEGSVTYGSAVAIACALAETDDEVPSGEEGVSPADSNEETPENAQYFTYFVTCLSVVEGAAEYNLYSSDGEVYTAEFIGADPNTDIAVLMVHGKFQTAEFVSDSSSVRLGDNMFAVGFPVNAGAGVVKNTTLGAKSHTVNVGPNVYNLMIVSDELNAGYAGGAAYVLNGGAICGLIAMINGVSADGYSFIIPSDTVVSVAKELIGTYGDGYGYIAGNFYLGATYEDSRMTSTKYVYISSIDTSGSMYLGGMRVGDRITHVDFIPYGEGEVLSADVSSKAELEAFIRSLTQLKIGDKLSFKYVRDRLSSSRDVSIVQYVYGAEVIV